MILVGGHYNAVNDSSLVAGTDPKGGGSSDPPAVCKAGATGFQPHLMCPP